MKVVHINGGVFGSTGKIIYGIKKICEERGYSVMCASPVTITNRYKDPDYEYYKIGTFYKRRVSVLLDLITGRQGGFAKSETRKLIRQIKKFNPDIIHLHNIHGSFVNLKMLFKYIKQSGVKVVWTLHDSWAFTGHCTHFDMIGCDKWVSGCFDCPQYRAYPKSLYDNSKKQYRIKKEIFTGIENLTIITPSVWLGNLVKQSFLGMYTVKTINNGIDLDVFKPVESNFRERYGVKDKKIVLGVSFVWNIEKGLDVFIKLAKILPDDYRIVLVGTDDNIDMQLPQNIIAIHRTQNQRELAEIYAAADVFVNPTRQDTLPTVNIEALACGTPVVAFNVGGNPEILNLYCGKVVEKDDISSMKNEIIQVCENQKLKKEDCVKCASRFRDYDKFSVYVDEYENIIK